MKIILAPDKFKGSLTSFEACESMREGILSVDPHAEIISIPLADGGDGFARVLKHYLHTTTIPCDCTDPLGRPMEGYYEWDTDTKTAIIELAVASGLTLLSGSERNPLLTSTYGTGLLIADAVKKGAEQILLGLGGSATNDAGIGILSALGFVFRNASGESLSPVGANLQDISSIEPPAGLPEILFQIACDVTNPLYGPNGAAAIYAPQKGADAIAVQSLDKGLRHFSELIFTSRGRDIASIPGTGAAGGIASGIMGFFETELKSGIEIVGDASGISDVLKDADLIITGEGKLDEQTAEGKVVQYIAALAKQPGLSVIALGGMMTLNAAQITSLGLEYASSIVSSPISLEDAMSNAHMLLSHKTASVFGFWKRMSEK